MTECEHNKPMYGCMQCAPQGKRIAELKAQLAEAQASNRQLVEAIALQGPTTSGEFCSCTSKLGGFISSHAFHCAKARDALTTPSAKRAQAEARVLAAAKILHQHADAYSPTGSFYTSDAEGVIAAVEALRAEEGV